MTNASYSVILFTKQGGNKTSLIGVGVGSQNMHTTIITPGLDFTKQYHSDLYCDITPYLAATIDLQLRSNKALC